MDNNESGAKYQAEGYAFWKAMEAYAAPYTDGCYNTQVHKVMIMGDINASACDSFMWTQHNGEGDFMCYNTVTHQVSTDVTTEGECDGYSNATFMDMYGAEKINEILNLQDATQLGTSYDIAPHLERCGTTTASPRMTLAQWLEVVPNPQLPDGSTAERLANVSPCWPIVPMVPVQP